MLDEGQNTQEQGLSIAEYRNECKEIVESLRDKLETMETKDVEVIRVQIAIASARDVLANLKRID